MQPVNRKRKACMQLCLQRIFVLSKCSRIGNSTVNFALHLRTNGITKVGATSTTGQVWEMASLTHRSSVHHSTNRSCVHSCAPPLIAANARVASASLSNGKPRAAAAADISESVIRPFLSLSNSLNNESRSVNSSFHSAASGLSSGTGPANSASLSYASASCRALSASSQPSSAAMSSVTRGAAETAAAMLM